MSLDPRAFLRELFDTAIAAAHPAQVLAQHLPIDKGGRTIVIGAGKAAGAMAEVAEQHWNGQVEAWSSRPTATARSAAASKWWRPRTRYRTTPANALRVECWS